LLFRAIDGDNNDSIIINNNNNNNNSGLVIFVAFVIDVIVFVDYNVVAYAIARSRFEFRQLLPCTKANSACYPS